MATDHIRYDVLARDALRGVLRRVLTDAAEHGLPGEHHFFITFLSTADGVKLSPRLLAQYPDEMTIILQHQFWDLVVTEDRFEVGLSFGGIPERLVVPFDGDQELSRSIGAVRPAIRAVRSGGRADGEQAAGCSRLRAVACPGGRACRREAPTNRQSPARAPKWCGSIASARNNPRDNLSAETYRPL